METQATLAEELNEELYEDAPLPEKATEGQGGPKVLREDEAEVYYCTPTKCYYSKDDYGNWIPQLLGDVKRFCELEKFSNISKAEGRAVAIERFILHVQRKLNVHYAGAVAGYSPGVYQIGVFRVLVTHGPKLIKARKGDWSTIKWFLDSLLGDQVGYFNAWMKIAWMSLAKGPRFRPGQAVVFAGKGSCGKSVLQDVITEILGGRAADPFKFLQGKSGFNAELIESEHLMIEDKASSTDTRTRRAFGAELKGMVANKTQRGEDKGVKAIRLSPFNRVTLSINEEPENLMVLPPLDESLVDKISLYLCSKVPFPFANDDQHAFDDWREKVTQELPAYVAYLRDWKIPADISDQRYGCKAWHNPTILAILEDLQPEKKLLEIIDALKPWLDLEGKFEGRASELEEKLLDKDKSGRLAKLLHFPTAMGVYLARLKKAYPERVSEAARQSGYVIWTVHPEKVVMTESQNEIP